MQIYTENECVYQVLYIVYFYIMHFKWVILYPVLSHMLLLNL